MKQKFGAGIWHFATYVDRYATDGYGEPRSVLDAIALAGKVRDLSVVDINFPYFGGQFSHQEIKHLFFDCPYLLSDLLMLLFYFQYLHSLKLGFPKMLNHLTIHNHEFP